MVVACGCIAFLMTGIQAFSDPSSDKFLSSPLVPVVLSGIAAYVVASIFFSVRAPSRSPAAHCVTIGVPDPARLRRTSVSPKNNKKLACKCRFAVHLAPWFNHSALTLASAQKRSHARRSLFRCGLILVRLTSVVGP